MPSMFLILGIQSQEKKKRKRKILASKKLIFQWGGQYDVKREIYNFYGKREKNERFNGIQ